MFRIIRVPTNSHFRSGSHISDFNVQYFKSLYLLSLYFVIKHNYSLPCCTLCPKSSLNCLYHSDFLHRLCALYAVCSGQNKVLVILIASFCSRENNGFSNYNKKGRCRVVFMIRRYHCALLLVRSNLFSLLKTKPQSLPQNIKGRPSV